ncbi:MAG: C25 family cysteine peptidase [Petrotogales bacterium]
MKDNLYKKTLVFIIMLLFLLGLIVPAINAASLKANISPTIISKPTYETTADESVYKLLIISPKEFAKHLEPLVCHKKKMGISTRLVTLPEVYDEMYWYGRDEAEKIKYFIKTAIEEWGIEYVLLVGGKMGQFPRWHVPVRYVYMGNSWEPKIMSDLYYADIYDAEGKFSSWNSDGDDLFGEWYYKKEAEDKYIDLYPDVAVGRLPCRHKLEVKIMVKKIIEYETTTYNKAWFNDMIVIAGDTYPESHNPNWTGYEGEYYAELALENMSDFNPIRLYTSDETLTGESDVITAVSKGCGFVYFVGHGSPRSWATHPPDDDKFIKGLGVRKMHRLRNNHRYPICVVSGCHNCQFDVSIFKFFNKVARYHGEATLECWGWRITRKIGGGSIATIGCTALGHTKEDKNSFQGGINEIEVEFFKQYGQNNIKVIGDTWVSTVAAYIDKYPVQWNKSADKDSWIDAQVVESWTLIGDPSLHIGGYPYQPHILTVREGII